MSRLILGINSAPADSSATLASEDGLLAAAAEERLTRRKHCAGFPARAIEEVLDIAGASPSDLTDIAVAGDPGANMAAKLAFMARHPLAGVPRAVARLRHHGEVGPTREALADALGVAEGRIRGEVHQVEHQLAHVASAFYGSPFERAVGFSVDDAGDFASHMLARGEGRDLWVLRRTLWPHSLGVFHAAVCQFLGFDRHGENSKVTDLAASGVNRFAPEMRELARFDSLRGIRLNLRYFRHQKIGLSFERLDDGEVSVPQLWSKALVTLLGSPRERGQPLGDRERDIAASLQARFEEIFLQLVEHGVRATGHRDAVFAGACARNGATNGRLITERWVDGACFHPAAGDDGTAAGAALHVLHSHLRCRRSHEQRTAYLGREYDDAEIEAALAESQLEAERLDRPALIARAADALAAGKIIGWFQGREEWGSEPLGNRSVLCHPSWPGSREKLNARIEHRESFRPFAPMVLAEKLGVCFRGDHEVPFKNVAFAVRPEWRSRLSSITGEDGSSLVQTVDRDQNELCHELIAAFEQRTDLPVVLNTSFDENEPLVHTPAQAIESFQRTDLDALGIGSYWLTKAAG